MSNENLKWKSIKALPELYNDAVNYRQRHQKELFNKLFLRTEAIEQCLRPDTYYLMGEKGAGKTAYAVYLENNSEGNTRCQVTTMTETQYKRFIQLKKNGKMDYSDYAAIWRAILLHLVAQMIVTKSKAAVHLLTGKFRKLEDEIRKFGKNAMNPEVDSAFEAVSGEKMGAVVKAKDIGSFNAEKSNSTKETGSTIKHHVMDAEASLRSAIADLKLENTHILFVDGIDYRPEGVSYVDYIECIKGMGEAVWQLNNDFFSSIKDSKGRIKVVLLVRPDVFHALNLYNSNSRLQDNTVFLDWTTTEKALRSSPLFEVSGRYFSSQQSFKPTEAEAWEHYYPSDGTSEDSVFRRALKNTFQKPRDIFTLIKISRNSMIKAGKGGEDHFPAEWTTAAAFTKEFSDYLLGEVRNYAAFYMTQEDFTIYMKFFQYLDGKSRFKMADFEKAHAGFSAWAAGEQIRARDYQRDPESLLQFLYDVNLIGYSEDQVGGGDRFFHWSFRERSLNNIAPKVKSSGTLMLNPGALKALDIGKKMVSDHEEAPRVRKAKPRNRKFIGKKKGKPA